MGEERVALGADRRTLVTTKPIGGIGLLTVYANEDLIVPNEGTLSGATVVGGRREPFRVVAGANTLTVVTQDHRTTVTLPTGYLPLSSILTPLNNAFSTGVVQAPVVATSENGYLRLSEQLERGPFSKIRLEGTATASLGFTHQSGSTGREVLPPWNLFSRTVLGVGEGYSEEGFFLRFAAPVRGNYYFRVTYSVAPYLCPRCGGTGVENDYRFDAQGGALMVDGYNLLYQACLKIILTTLGSNPYYRWYGTNLARSIGTKLNSGSAQAIQQAIRQSLSNLQNLQGAQAKYQRVTAAERLYAVDKVEVTQSPTDPTTFLVDVTVRSYSNDPVNITIVYTAPGTFALPGTNGLTLGNFG